MRSCACGISFPSCGAPDSTHTRCCPRADPLVDWMRSASGPVEDLPVPSYACGRKTPSDILRFPADTFRAAASIRRAVDRYRIDLAYVNGPRAPSRCRPGWCSHRVPRAQHIPATLHPGGAALVFPPIRWAGNCRVALRRRETHRSRAATAIEGRSQRSLCGGGVRAALPRPQSLRRHRWPHFSRERPSRLHSRSGAYRECKSARPIRGRRGVAIFRTRLRSFASKEARKRPRAVSGLEGLGSTRAGGYRHSCRSFSWERSVRGSLSSGCPRSSRRGDASGCLSFRGNSGIDRARAHGVADRFRQR